MFSLTFSLNCIPAQERLYARFYFLVIIKHLALVLALPGEKDQTNSLGGGCIETAFRTGTMGTCEG